MHLTRLSKLPSTFLEFTLILLVISINRPQQTNVTFCMSAFISSDLHLQHVVSTDHSCCSSPAIYLITWPCNQPKELLHIHNNQHHSAYMTDLLCVAVVVQFLCLTYDLDLFRFSVYLLSNSMSSSMCSASVACC